MENTHPRDYIVAIRYDGMVFRADKDAQETDMYTLQYGNQPCAFRSEYFNHSGYLKKEFWNLPILKKNKMKKAKIKVNIKKAPPIYKGETQNDKIEKAGIIMEIYNQILTYTTVKGVYLDGQNGRMVGTINILSYW